MVCLEVSEILPFLLFISLSLFTHHHLPLVSLTLPENNDKGLGFVCLTFVGSSLIAVFDNGQVFGIADVPVDKICHLASSDPKLLSVAIQKLKFLKCSLPSAQLHAVDSLRKAVVFSDNTTERADGFTVAIVDRVKGLWVGSLGSKTGLRCQELTSNFSIAQQKYGVCCDLALLPSHQPHTDSGKIDGTDGGWGTAVVLFGTGTNTSSTLCVVNLVQATVLTAIPLSFPFARISLLTCIPQASTVPATIHADKMRQEAVVHVWDSFLVGLVPSAAPDNHVPDSDISTLTSISAATAAPHLYAMLRGNVDSNVAAIYLGHALPPSEYVLPVADSVPPSDLLMLTAQSKGLDRGTESVLAVRGVSLSTSLLHTLETIIAWATKATSKTTMADGSTEDDDENMDDFNSMTEGDMDCISEAGGAIGRLLRCILTADNPSPKANGDDDSSLAMASVQANAGQLQTTEGLVQGQGLGLVMADVLPLLQRQVVTVIYLRL